MDFVELGQVSATGLKLEWRIKNLNKSLSKYQSNQEWRSPTYHLGCSKSCYLSLYPRGSDKSCRDYMSLFLYSHKTCTFDASSSFYILNSTKQEVNEWNFPTFRYDEENGNGTCKFIKRNKVLSDETFLQDGNLIIGCTLSIDSPERLNDPTEMVLQDDMVTLPENILVKEFNKYENLLENRESSDIKFLVQGKAIFAHKNIVAAGSPVFAAMFSHPFKENNNNVVKVPDIRFDVMQELLRFLYASRVRNMRNVAVDLLVAAEKYSIINLKIICENYLSEELDVDNVVQLLTLADTHNASFLRNACIKFIKEHIEELVESPNFYEWELESDVLKEILQLVVRSQRNLAQE